MSESQSFRTAAAAEYVTAHGRTASKSYLEKCRARGPDDRRDVGPDFWRDENGVCWYERSALDRWIAAHVAARKFREPAPQPENFRKAG